MYSIGIDIGGTTVKFGIFAPSGKLIKKWAINTVTKDSGKYIFGDIASSLKNILHNQNISILDIDGIGVGVPGPVLNETTVNGCVNLGWGVLDIASKLRELTKITNIKAVNDANAAALGEMWQGAAKGKKNVVMVTLGTGVGSGVVIDGKIVAGAFGAGGEIGHIKVADKRPCNCGKCGCLEQYASATGIVRSAKEMLDATDEESSLRLIDNITCRSVFDCAKQQDALSLKIIKEATSKLAYALSCVSCVVDPEVFVIGGGVSNAGNILLDYIQKAFCKNAFFASRNVPFTLATLGGDAGIYGAAKLVL